LVATVATRWRRSRFGGDGRDEVATVAVGVGVAIADRGRDLPSLIGTEIRAAAGASSFSYEQPTVESFHFFLCSHASRFDHQTVHVLICTRSRMLLR
jgi:hypothetical protein